MIGGAGQIFGAIGQQQANSDYSKMLAQQNVAMPAAPPRTLTSAISNASQLNQRLAEVGERVLRIATTVGGPFPAPVSTPDAPTKTVAVSVMGELNDQIDFAHQRLNGLIDALGALERAVGA